MWLTGLMFVVAIAVGGVALFAWSRICEAIAAAERQQDEETEYDGNWPKDAA